MIILNNGEILLLTYDLKDSILSSDLYKDLKEKEKKMLDDEECFKLLCSFQTLKHEYEEAKRFEKYSSDVKSIQSKLSQLKIEIDNNKLVKEYNCAYKVMKRELKKLENIIFDGVFKKRKAINIEE